MLPRTLEPEVMDSPDEASDYDSMDHAQVNRVFVADFLAVWDGVGPILDVGTGTAQIPIELCRTDARPQVVGIDLAKSMLELGNSNIKRAGLSERIRLECVDAKQMPYSDGAFGAVISNSIIHHIPEPATSVAEMVRVCKPGGRLFVRDLMRPSTESELEHLVAVYAAGANDHQRALYRASLHAALTLDEVRGLVRQFGFDANGVQATSDRHWTWSAVRPK